MSASPPQVSQQSIKTKFYENYKKLLVSVGGPQTRSTFQNEGKLTPAEFLEAGESLRQKAPMWEWRAGPAIYVPLLPEKQKYLIMKGVLCETRPGDERTSAAEELDENGFLLPPKIQPAASAAPEPVLSNTDDDDGIVLGGDEDPDKVPAAATSAAAPSQVRTYDVSLVYDEFYASPRVYLSGSSATLLPLTKDQMLEDVFAQNREKTVTVDPHPVTRQPCLSVHPCRHAETMKRTLDRLDARFVDEQEADGVPASARVPFVFPSHLALFVFLRFIQSVVPTIQYDCGIDVEN